LDNIANKPLNWWQYWPFNKKQIFVKESAYWRNMVGVPDAQSIQKSAGK